MAGTFALEAVFEQITVSQKMGSCSDPKPFLGGSMLERRALALAKSSLLDMCMRWDVPDLRDSTYMCGAQYHGISTNNR
jgi:hypothetical protein